MLTENKFSKYLFYAVGEIVLVVIGILIALQVNNWNVNRLKVKERNKIIENLNLELISNLRNLNSTIELSETYINSTEALLLAMNDSTSNNYKGEKLDSLLSKLAFSKWKRSDLNIKSIESSGSLNNVENSELNNLIYDWIGQIKDLEKLELRSDYAYQYYIDFIKKNGSWREIDIYI